MFEVTFGRITRHGKNITPVSRISEHTFTKSFHSLAEIAKFWNDSCLKNKTWRDNVMIEYTLCIVHHNLNKHQFQMLTRKMRSLRLHYIREVNHVH